MIDVPREDSPILTMSRAFLPNGLGTITGSNSTFGNQVFARADVTPNQFRESLLPDVKLTPPETNTVIAACVMFIAILIAWNLPVLREVIAAMKVSDRTAELRCHDLTRAIAIHSRRSRGIASYGWAALRRSSRFDMY